MKITDFINSISIADYLTDINYEFNAAEAAFIVWQSNCSSRKKYAAWRNIIETYPDMPLKQRRFGIKKDEPSFLAFLNDYIQARKTRNAFKYNCDPFEGMWFKFPTPFKVGDIVVYQGNQHVYCGDEPKEPFVLLDMANWGEEELRENGYTDEKEIARSERLVQLHLTDGDITDMDTAGYFVSEFGIMYREHTTSGTYLDLEYYDEPLDGEKSILTALSNYTRGKIDIATLANAYRILSDEARIGHINKCVFGAYFDEHLKRAGVK